MRYLLATCILTAAITTAQARYDTRSYGHFGHKSCSTSSCFAKHPSGSYAFPFHRGRRH